MTSEQFRERLLGILDRKDHEAWPRWTGPGVTRAQLRLSFEQEWLVFIRDFPMLLGRVHGRCPVPSVRRALAANLYEEETGGISGTRPHPELFLEQMAALGLSRATFEDACPLPESAAYRAHIDLCTSLGSWVVGAAVTTLWLEGSVNERKALSNDVAPLAVRLEQHHLVRHHGLSPAALTLNAAHDAVEQGHRRDAWAVVLGHATYDDERMRVIDAMETSCALWHLFRDGVTRAAAV